MNEIYTDLGLKFEINEKIGSGSQGVLYKATRKNKGYAVKVYSQINNNLWENIKSLVLSGVPTIDGKKNHSFVWPLYYIEDPFYGYIMDYVDLSLYSSLEEVKQQKLSIIDRIKIGIKVLEAIKSLHETKGKIYIDISSSNILINTKDLSIKIVDNDNIGFTSNNVIGSPGFINREVLLGNKPNFESDTFACYVFLHELVFSHHPFDGEFAAKYDSLEEGVTKSILLQKGYIFDSIENKLLKSELRPKAIWDYFIDESVREFFKTAYREYVRLDVAIKTLTEFVNNAKACECGELTSTEYCSICYKQQGEL